MTKFTADTPMTKLHAFTINVYAAELGASVNESRRAASIKLLPGLLDEIARLLTLSQDESLPEEATDKHYADYWAATERAAEALGDLTDGDISRAAALRMIHHRFGEVKNLVSRLVW